MMPPRSIPAILLMILAAGLASTFEAEAHPLGQFSVNHFACITVEHGRVRIRYIIDLAEVPTFQASQTADADSDGVLSDVELNEYLSKVGPAYARNLSLVAGDTGIPLEIKGREILLLPGTSGSNAMGLAILRIELDLEGIAEAGPSAVRFRFEDRNDMGRPGWRELVLQAAQGVSVFNSTLVGNGVTDELKAYPENPALSPLSERTGEWEASTGPIPAGAAPLKLRSGSPAGRQTDRMAALIAVPALTPAIVIYGLLFAFALGGIHALSPGHGKTIVGAYLIGTHGTAAQAGLLGLTVTASHTIGVYALGFATLFASNYVLPERLYPAISLLSGAAVMTIGLTMLVRRIRGHHHHHGGDHHHHHGHHHHRHVQDHGDTGHSHPANGWKSLLALGISGGIMPCPSALVVMLAAISLNRVGYGLVLILAFSCGLAFVLTAVGIAFVHGGKLLDRLPGGGGWLRIVPIISSLVISIAGGIIVWQSAGEIAALLARH